MTSQVLNAFASNALEKLNATPPQVLELLDYFEKLDLVPTTFSSVEKAISVMHIARLSFWDASIIASAAEGDCDQVLTEDLNDGQTIGGIRIVNPFRA